VAFRATLSPEQREAPDGVTDATGEGGLGLIGTVTGREVQFSVFVTLKV
jgi:hypothetical protein